VRVRLTEHQLRQAAQAGVERQILAIRNGRRDSHGFEGDGWGLHIEGACAELAVAKCRNKFWEAVVDVPEGLEGDVGRAQVRSTRRASGCLLVHPDDPDPAPFVLVIVRSPYEYDVVGWIEGRNAKREEWWRTDTGRPAFFVPQSALNPL
jgi:hypothetical protein